MAYTKEPRKITKHQFASTTTVDGSRIDACMEDVEQRVNNVEHGDIDTAWVQNVFHAGWQPKGREFPFVTLKPEDTYDFKHHYPWLAAKNEIATDGGQLTLDSSDNVTTAPDSALNLFRLKGYDNGDGNAVHTTLSDNLLKSPFNSTTYNRMAWQRVWTTSFYFRKPTVITQISLIIRADGADSTRHKQAIPVRRIKRSARKRNFRC